MLDALARRYSVLPSVLMAQGDTFDLMVMDVAVGYEKYINSKQNNQVDPNMYNTQDLQEKLNNFRLNYK